LLWFGGIGTYLKASTLKGDVDVGDVSNDALRAMLWSARESHRGGGGTAHHSGSRIEFAEQAGASTPTSSTIAPGVDCSDMSDIKIPLNREMRDGRLSFETRNTLLARMTDEVAELVLEDTGFSRCWVRRSRRRAELSRSPATCAPSSCLKPRAAGRKVEGSRPSKKLIRRGQDNRGLTRPELSVVLSISKIVLQDAAELLHLSQDKVVEPQLFEAFPETDAQGPASAIRAHRLRDEIIATKVVNRLVNRLGPGVAFDLTEEEGSSLEQVIAAFLVAERLLDLDDCGARSRTTRFPKPSALSCSRSRRQRCVRICRTSLRSAGGEIRGRNSVQLLEPGVRKISAAATKLIPRRGPQRSGRAPRSPDRARRKRDIVRGWSVVRARRVFGIAALAQHRKVDELR